MGRHDAGGTRRALQEGMTVATSHDDQLALFAPPAMPEPPRATTLAVPVARAVYSPYKVQGRRACDECLVVCHEANHSGRPAPLPQPATWRRKAGTHVLHLCHAHKRQREDADGAQPSTPTPARRAARPAA